MNKLYLTFALALGLSACFVEVTPVPPTEDEDEVDGEVDQDVPVDPAGDNVPGKGDGGCGAQFQDGTSCTPK